MTLVDQALALAAQGFWVFPGSNKQPLVKYTTEASRDPEKIKAMFAARPRADRVHIFTGKFRDDEALLVLDVDVKGGKDGRKAVLALELRGDELPETRRHQRAGSEGYHLLYATREPVRSSVSKLGDGLDIKSKGALIVAYTGNDHPVAPAPKWLIDRCGQRPERKETVAEPVQVDRDTAERRAIAYLTDEAELSIEGQGGDITAFRTAARLKDIGLAEADALGLMLDTWNDRCQPPWAPDDLAQKVANAYAYGSEKPGAAAPEADFDPLPRVPIDTPPPVEAPTFEGDWLARMNAQYSVVCEGGHALVFEKIKNASLGYPTIRRLEFEDLKKKHLNRVVQVGSDEDGKPILKKVAAAWLEHPERRQYLNGTAFLPMGEAPPGVYNTWLGFGVVSREGDWSLLREHVRAVVCNGVPEHFAYLMGWMALLVQRLDDRAMTAVVLRGDEGVGKGILGNALGALFGAHSFYATSPDHLIGRFNAHLRDIKFLFADEALYAANPEHESRLKGLVTDPHLAIEAKFQTPEKVRNIIAILMASNSAWVVPAGPTARRFFVLDVPATRKGDRAYFDAIFTEMKRGGLGAMLFDLLNHDITSFDVTAVPQTAALAEQKALSLRGPDRWLFGCLQDGEIAGVEWADAGARVQTGSAYDAYRREALARKEYRPELACNWAKALRKILGAENCRNTRTRVMGERQYFTAFGGLADCRSKFEAHLGQPIKWDGFEDVEAGNA